MTEGTAMDTAIVVSIFLLIILGALSLGFFVKIAAGL